MCQIYRIKTLCNCVYYHFTIVLLHIITIWIIKQLLLGWKFFRKKDLIEKKDRIGESYTIKEFKKKLGNS